MKICYFGIYDPEFGRNKVYMAGLRKLGHDVVECRDSSPGLLKYIRLRRKHRAILKKGGYDALIVGYPGHVVVPFAKRISNKPVIFDALCTLYEGEVLSRGKYRSNPLMRSWINYIDTKAAKSADIILVESQAQKAFFVERFALDPATIERIYTGCDENVFKPDLAQKKRDRFTVVFRGKFLPEAGVKHVVAAAKILEDSGVDFLILGHGFLEKEIREEIARLEPKNLEWLGDKLPPEDMARRMAECHVSLGQFEDHERLSRTIPHKAFESLALGLPYVTGRTAGASELLTDGKDCLMVNCADPKDLAAKILRLKNEPAVCAGLSKNGRFLYDTKLRPEMLARDIIQAIISSRSSQNN